MTQTNEKGDNVGGHKAGRDLYVITPPPTNITSRDETPSPSELSYDEFLLPWAAVLVILLLAIVFFAYFRRSGQQRHPIYGDVVGGDKVNGDKHETHHHTLPSNDRN